MRGFAIAGLALWLAVPVAAAAQSATIAVPPAPPLVAAPPSAVPAQPSPAAPDVTPPAVPDLVPPPSATAGGNTDTAAPPAAAAPGGGGADATPPPPVASWVPGATAELGVLNEVDGSVSQVQIPVGGQAVIGDLTVGVLACLRRPPDQVPDAAAFVAAQSGTAPASSLNPAASPPQADPNQTATGAPDQPATTPADSDQSGATVYRGWMLRSAPGAAVVGDAGETFRIIDCS